MLVRYKNNKGIALVTSLMFTLISLVIILSVMYLVTQGINKTAMYKRYKNTVEASYGGTDIVMKDVLPYIFRNFSSTNLTTRLETNFSAINMTAASQACLLAKSSQLPGSWPSACSSTLEAKQLPDFTFTLQASTGNPYTIYTKIVDTFVGNSDLSGLQLEGAGTSEVSSVLTPQHSPYVYRVEVQGERSTNATERSKMSVLYAY